METFPVNSNWVVHAWTDDFTDKKSCAVAPAKKMERGRPSIIIFAKHEEYDPHTILNASGDIGGIGIKYRVDKKRPVQLGYESQTNGVVYILQGADHEEMVAAFKSGNTLVYKVTSENQFVDSETDRISLSGFTKAYNLAKSCKY